MPIQLRCFNNIWPFSTKVAPLPLWFLHQWLSATNGFYRNCQELGGAENNFGGAFAPPPWCCHCWEISREASKLNNSQGYGKKQVLTSPPPHVRKMQSAIVFLLFGKSFRINLQVDNQKLTESIKIVIFMLFLKNAWS